MRVCPPQKNKVGVCNQPNISQKLKKLEISGLWIVNLVKIISMQLKRPLVIPFSALIPLYLLQGVNPLGLSNIFKIQKCGPRGYDPP